MRNKLAFIGFFCRPIRLAFILAFLLCAPTLHAETIRGTVVHIVDGDTFDIVDDAGTKTRIRMQAIDAPDGWRLATFENFLPPVDKSMQSVIM